MKQAHELIPWKVTDISVQPYGTDYWSMNPSIHLDPDGTWRCVTRIVDYAMPGGITVRSKKSGPGHQTKNAMLILDPQTLRPIRIFKMHERDNTPRVHSANVGFEDMRLFMTDRGGLQGIAASLHLARGAHPKDGGAQHQPPEQVVLSFDAEYNIVTARPVRGDWWSSMPQKNWVPFDQCVEPRFLYSIERGAMFDERGPVSGDAAIVRPSARVRPVMADVPVANVAVGQVTSELPSSQPSEAEREQGRQREQEGVREREQRKSKPKHPDRRTMIRGNDVQMVRGGRMALDTLSSRRSSAPTKQSGARSGGGVGDSTRVLGNGRTLMPKYEGLRGGTQLVRVGDDAWLGIGHAMRFEKGLKYYWHIWYLTDSRGKMKAASEPMKFVTNGIEFAAGMAIDGERVVVSFGVDDAECRLGETKLSAVLGILRPVER